MHAKPVAILNMMLDAVLPPRCVVSGEIVERQGMISPSVWNDLDFIAKPFCRCCGIPFGFEVEQDMLCTVCLDRPPAFVSNRSALVYNDASRPVILGFKHGDKTHAVSAFVPMMRRAGGEILSRADMLVPVPLHYWRMVFRRYNQSALIAHALGGATGIRVAADVLLRTRATPPQGHLNAKERRKNVRKAFAINEGRRTDIKGKVIVLIDDVYTTGATLDECAKALLAGGAAEVHALTLARAVREGVFGE